MFGYPIRCPNLSRLEVTSDAGSRNELAGDVTFEVIPYRTIWVDNGACHVGYVSTDAVGGIQGTGDTLYRLNIYHSRFEHMSKAV